MRVMMEDRKLLRLPSHGSLAAKAKLKAHMRNGDLFLLTAWQPDVTAGMLACEGIQLDANRKIVGRGSFSIAVDAVVIFERASVSVSTPAQIVNVLTVASVGPGI